MWTLKFTLQSISLFLSSFIITTFSKEQCHPNDKSALLKVSLSLGNSFPSWENNTDCCTDWYGVTCDPKTHRVTSLFLIGDDNISGQFPTALGDVTYLDSLRFHKFPKVTGPIPKSLTKLKKIRWMVLTWNNLTGPVPSFLSQMKSLENLELSFNSLSGSIPPSLSQLPRLFGLSLDRNKLTGTIPESFGSFKQGDFYLVLSHNQLSGPIPKSLGSVDFTHLDLSRNQLTGDASFLVDKKKGLEMVDLSRNLLEFELSNIEFDSNLYNIDLNHNKIYGGIPQSLVSVPQLQFLNVSYNRLSGPIPTGGQLSRFDQYTYFHNRCLCGSPLQPCK